MKKRILTLLLAAMMAVSLFPAAALAGIEYTICFQYNIGTPTKYVIVPAGEGGADPVYKLSELLEEIKAPEPIRSGYAFLGWDDGTHIYSSESEYTFTSNVTFNAVWVRHPDTPYVPETEPQDEPEAAALPFSDVSSSAWYYSAVKYVYDNKLMDGVDTYVFAPNDTLTRAMVWS